MPRVILESLRKREILYDDERSRQELYDLARAYEEAHLLGDAAQFMAESRVPEALRALKDMAMKEGDAWMLILVARVDPELVTNDDWQKLADKARRLGKDGFARRAEFIMGGGGFMDPIPSEDTATEGEAEQA
jgi:hypothetical protein